MSKGIYYLIMPPKGLVVYLKSKKFSNLVFFLNLDDNSAMNSNFSIEFN